MWVVSKTLVHFGIAKIVKCSQPTRRGLRLFVDETSTKFYHYAHYNLQRTEEG